MLSNGSAAGVQSGPRPDRRFREFVVLSRCEGDERSGDRHAGPGLGLDRVVEAEVRAILGSEADEVPRSYPTADDRLADLADLVVWGPEPDRVAAVILPRPGGVKVVRLDREVPEDPERGPTNVRPRRTPPAVAEIPPDEARVLEMARGIGVDQAKAILFACSSLKSDIVPGSRDSRVTEALGRLLLLPEDRFPWRRAAGFTTTDDEAREAMERIRAEHPGYQVASVLTAAEREMLDLIRRVGLAGVNALVASMVALGLDLDEALGRLARPGPKAVPPAGPEALESTLSTTEGTPLIGAEPEPEVEEETDTNFDPRRHRAAPPAFTVAVEGFVQYHSHRASETLDDMIAGELTDSGYADDEDRAIWRDGRLLAVVRLADGRDPEVIRLDGGPGLDEASDPADEDEAEAEAGRN